MSLALLSGLKPISKRLQVFTTLPSLRSFQQCPAWSQTQARQAWTECQPQVQQGEENLQQATGASEIQTVVRTARRSDALPEWLAAWHEAQADSHEPDLEAVADSSQLLSGCEADKAPLRVALLLSGGVDSSLALQLAKAAGHHVTAFYLRIWFQEGFQNFWASCPWEDDLQVCTEVCEDADVPLEVVPLSQQYWDFVVQESVAEIRAGRTPNPDILCNSRVKFGAFVEYLRQLQETQGTSFDRIASGHYARIVRSEDPAEPVRLALTPDSIKDQTYFLARLSQSQLQQCMFPLGALTKAQVRQLAAAADLPNKARRDSQGICFLGKFKYEDFVKEHLGEWPGPLIDDDTGQVLGYHKGIWFHTVGQRRGVPLSGGPWYVTRKNLKKNAVYISRTYYGEDRIRDAFQVGNFNWFSGQQPDLRSPDVQLLCKIRHGPKLYRCYVKMIGDGSADVKIDGNDQGLAPGQSAVFYRDGICLGAATILASASPGSSPSNE